MQTPRMSTVLVDHAEDLVDTIRKAASDGYICAVELMDIASDADTVYRYAMVNDLNVQDVVAQLRTGPDSIRTQRTSAELRNGLKLLKGGKDTHENARTGGHDPSAA